MDSNNFIGISIYNFPLATSKEDICDLLAKKAPNLVKNIKKEEVLIVKDPKNQSVRIKPVDPSLVLKLHSSLHYPEIEKNFFGNTLYCKPIMNLTPKKTLTKTSTPLVESKLRPGKPLPQRTKSKRKSIVVEPPGIEDFQFSDYSSDNNNFEDSKEPQSSDSDSDGNDTQLVKRKAGSPLCQEETQLRNTVVNSLFLRLALNSRWRQDLFTFYKIALSYYKVSDAINKSAAHNKPNHNG